MEEVAHVVATVAGNYIGKRWAQENAFTIGSGATITLLGSGYFAITAITLLDMARHVLMLTR